MKKNLKNTGVLFSVFLLISIIAVVNPCNASTLKQKEITKDIVFEDETNDKIDEIFEKIMDFIPEKLGIIRDICATVGLWIGFFIGLVIAIVTLGAGIIMVPICAGIGWFIGDTIGFLIEDQLFPGF
jgi:hypothetical protein